MTNRGLARMPAARSPDRRWRRSFAPLLLVVLALGAACDDSRPEGPCTPGDSDPCGCPAGVSGVRVCRFDETFSACLCGGSDAGVVPDAGSVADAGAESVSYSAVAFATALDRVGIFKADFDADRCVALVLVAPATGGVIPLDVPAGWGVERAWVARGTAGCGELFPGADAGVPVSASSGSGTVTWMLPDAGFGYPCSLDVDVTLTFPPGEPWVPTTETLRATGLAVAGTCP